MERSGIHPFMEHLIDYAGIFPPASLPLDVAITNYAAYRKGEEAWMLGRFVIPVSRLGEITPYVSLFTREVTLGISAIGQKSSNWKNCLAGWENDLREISKFREAHKERVEIGVMELPLPQAEPEVEQLEKIARITAEQGLVAFCEIPLSPSEEWEPRVEAYLDAIAAHNSRGPALGVKLRTGGVVAEAFPSPGQVALVLQGCRDRGIAMKFTAGLHHPLRMFRNEVGAKMHGFLNVFAAAMLACVHKLDKPAIVEILEDESADSFTFDENGLSWRNLSISNEEIARLRDSSFCSYGCCSFDEPREELRMLRKL